MTWIHSITTVVLGPTTVNGVADAVGNETGGSVTMGEVIDAKLVGTTDPLVVVASAANPLSVKDANVVERTSVVGTAVPVLKGSDEVVASSEDGKEQT